MFINDVPWRVPVAIRLQCGLERTFHTAFDALDFLENEWPLRHGERYERAINQCRGAISRTVPAEVAREALIAACLEAGMPALLGSVAPRTEAQPKTASRA